MEYNFTTTRIKRTMLPEDEGYLSLSFEVMKNGYLHTEYIVDVNLSTKQVFWYSEVECDFKEFQSLKEAKVFAYLKITTFRKEAIPLETYSNPVLT